jgi:hypothetical protein
MAVDGPQINRAARPTARTEDIQPGRSGDQRGPDRGRPQHVAAGGQASIQRSTTSCASRHGAVSLTAPRSVGSLADGTAMI